MGFFYKYIVHPLLSHAIGKKAMTNNPYLGLVIDSDVHDVLADELFLVSLAYQKGLYMLPQSDSKAKSYCLLAAKRGHAVAQLFAAQWMMREPNDSNEQVMYWLQKAAEQGERQSLYNLGISYHRGDIGGAADIAKSNELFRQSAEFAYIPAYTRMAQIYFNGDGVEKNNIFAKYWAWLEFSNMAEQDREKSILNLLIEESDIKEDNAINHKKIIEDAANAGERDAINNWATGLHNTGDKAKAIELWEKAAKLGHPLAICNLARQYWTEEKKEYKKALELFQQSASFQYEGAFYGLAVMYYNGLGVDKDIVKAWNYLEKCLNLGNDGARYLFAIMCINKDLESFLPDRIMRGMHYMEQAAQNGYKPAIEFYNSQNEQ